MFTSAIPAVWSAIWRKHVWYPIVCWTLSRGGAAWIKWAQWASTRPDIFPESLCARLATLQTAAPAHSFGQTRREVESMFGAPLEAVFSSFNPTPVASGSIAQVHFAKYQNQSAAVKVRHPNVARQISIDFRIMAIMGELASKVPMLKFLNLKASVEAFSHTMTGQTLLDIEANHLALFNRNFARWADVGFPCPFVSSEAVLVESFEEGHLVSKFTAHNRGSDAAGAQPLVIVEGNGPIINPRLPVAVAHFIVTRGEDLYLKMLLVDGLMHADLHPGNIFVTFDPYRRYPRGGDGGARIILVDAGMVAKLSLFEQENFIGLLECMITGDGAEAATHVLNFSTEQTCAVPAARAAFTEAMRAFFLVDCRGLGQGISLAKVLRGVLTLVRDHGVRIDVNYATLVMNALCLDGLANALLPSYNVLDAAAPLLMAHRRWKGVLGRTVLLRVALPLAQRKKHRHDRIVNRRLAKAFPPPSGTAPRKFRRYDSLQSKFML
jgi:aarF domain-containing kinase